jgi:DNA-binding MarR family transcriptional regulator
VFEYDNVTSLYRCTLPEYHMADRLMQQIINHTRELQGLIDDMPPSPTRETTYAQFARLLVRERSDRHLVLDAELSGDPAWDILLDLFTAGEEGKQVSVSSVCHAAGVPPTTALRWLSILVERDFVTRVDDAHDKRRVNLLLSPRTRASLIEYLDRAAARRCISLSVHI